MYIENVYLSKKSPWLYWVFPLLFFSLMGINFVVMHFTDSEYIISQEIEKKGENIFLLESLSFFAILLAFLFFWVRFVHKQKLIHLTTTRTKFDWNRAFFSFTLWGGAILFLLAVDYAIYPENYQWNFHFLPFLQLFIISIFFIPLQTSFEEYFFRGYLMQALGIATGNRWFPLLTTSLIFGLMHIANPEISKLGYILLLYYIGTGLLLGVTTLMDGGLELALGFHAANNLITALFLTANWTAFQTPSLFKDLSDPTVGFDIFFPLLVLFPILLFIFARKYHWNQWREKLTGKLIKKQEFLIKYGKNE